MNKANKLIRLSKTLAHNNFLCRRWLHGSLFSCAKQTEILLEGQLPAEATSGNRSLFSYFYFYFY